MKSMLTFLFAFFSFAAFSESGLLLVKTEPAEAEVICQGVSLGATPRLVTILETGKTHRLELKKNGYQSKTVEVKFLNGREPVVIQEKLVLDSGTINVKSDPIGAKVILNGIDRGVTPLTLTEIPKGTATLVLKREGFQDLTREFKIKAGDEEEMYLKMSALPGTLQITSIPSGARVYLDEEPRGVTPLVMTAIEPKLYNVKVELDGYESETRQLSVDNGGALREEFRLRNIMGRLEVRSAPAGADVYIDGKLRGYTKKSPGDEEFSAIYPVDDLAEGEHTLELKMKGYAVVTRHPKIQARKTSKANVRMKRVFIPDFEITLSSGVVHRGVYVSSSVPGMVVLETQLGVIQSFPESDIIKRNYLENKAE